MAGVTERIKARWAALRQRHTWLGNAVDAWQHLSRNNGNQYAAAITYFSFLALFPLLLLAVSITGFVLHSHQGAERDLFAHITDNVPGDFGNTLKSSLHSAINSRAGLGVIGLLGVLLTGLGWIGNLRTAIDAVWGRTPPAVNFVKAKIANLGILAGLGLGSLVSLGLTVVGTSVTDQLLRAVGWDHLTGAHELLKLFGIALAVLADVLIFWWLLVRLPQVDIPRRIALRGALLASVGFEALKIAGTYTIAHTANSPTAGPFAGIIAILVWIQLVARMMLFACAWMATVAGKQRVTPAEQPIVGAVAEPAEVDADAPEISPTALGVTLVGAGMVAGAAATWALTRPRGGPGH